MGKMINVLKSEYWSKADAFLLPLTGLQKNEQFELNSYLFWNDYSVEDYKLILSFSAEDQDEEFQKYYKRHLFKILDKKCCLVESYDIQGRSIFVLDMSEWAMDIEQFLAGKYSKFSSEVKELIQRFHTFNGSQIPIYIYSVLYPNKKMQLLDGLSPIEYVSRNYDFDLDTLKKLGEVGGKYNEMEETLLTDIEGLCQTDIQDSENVSA